MTDILDAVAADAVPRAPPAGASASQAAANVSAIIRAAAEAAVAASSGRGKRIAGRTSSRASSRASSATASATASPSRPERRDAGEYAGYSLAHTPTRPRRVSGVSPRAPAGVSHGTPVRRREKARDGGTEEPRRDENGDANASFESAFAALTAATRDAKSVSAKTRDPSDAPSVSSDVSAWQTKEAWQRRQ